MSKMISGIEAAQMEKQGLGSLTIKGKTLTFYGNDGRSVSWTLPSGMLANAQLRFFRGASE